MEWVPILVALAVTGTLVAAIAYANGLAERRRAEALQELAPMLGFTLEPQSQKLAESGIDATLLAFPLFGHGGGRRVRNVLRASSANGEEIILEFRYVVSTGKSSHTVEQTVFAFRRPGLRLPAFQLHPERLLDKIGQAFGGQDIDFDSNEVFSKSYLLKGEDADAVRALFERRAVAYLSDRPGWSVEGGGDCLIVFRASKREKVEHLREWLDQARQIARVLDPR